MKLKEFTLYELEYSHIIFPAELIQNVKLPNYEYVNFTRNEQGIIVETACILEDRSSVKFNYYFDQEDRLMKLISVDGINVEIIFDRIEEIKRVRNQWDLKMELQSV